jgi:hypothetical protein
VNTIAAYVPRSAASAKSASPATIEICLRYATGPIQIFVAANSTYRKLKRVVAKLLKARGFPRASFSLHFDGRVLSNYPERLADMGLISGSTVHVNLCCLRGGGGASRFVKTSTLREDLKKTQSGKHGKYSITREGLAKLFRALLPIARARGYKRGMGRRKGPAAAVPPDGPVPGPLLR